MFVYLTSVQYCELSHLANDLVTSLCSEDKLKDLLLEVTDRRRDLSWQKVDSWTKAIVASLRKMKMDYSSYPDVVAPFSTGLTLVSCSLCRAFTIVYSLSLSLSLSCLQILDGLNVLSLVNRFREDKKV